MTCSFRDQQADKAPGSRVPLTGHRTSGLGLVRQTQEVGEIAFSLLHRLACRLHLAPSPRTPTQGGVGHTNILRTKTKINNRRKSIIKARLSVSFHSALVPLIVKCYYIQNTISITDSALVHRYRTRNHTNFTKRQSHSNGSTQAVNFPVSRTSLELAPTETVNSPAGTTHCARPTSQ